MLEFISKAVEKFLDATLGPDTLITLVALAAFTVVGMAVYAITVVVKIMAERP
jgi:hypothetical protein